MTSLTLPTLQIEQQTLKNLPIRTDFADSPAKTPRPKVKIDIDLSHSPLKLQHQPKALSQGLESTRSSKRMLQNDMNTARSSQNNTTSPLLRRIAKSESVMAKANQVGVAESVSPLMKEPMLRIPDGDLYSDVETKESTCDENESATPDFNEQGQSQLFARRKTHAVTLCFGESPKQLNIIDHEPMTPAAGETVPVSARLASERTRTVAFTQTLKDIGFRTTFHSPKGSSSSTTRRCVKVKIPSSCNDEDISPKKTSKAQGKIQAAFEKAKVYDKMILQQDFEHQEEEEERDFCELYEILNAKFVDQ